MAILTTAAAAAAATPISSLQKRAAEPRKLLKLPKPPTSLQKHLHATLLTGLASFSSAAFAKALTYEEALSQSAADVSSFVDGFLNFVTQNPLVVGGGAVAIAVPLVLSQLLGKPKAYAVVSAKSGYAKLCEEDGVQLLDIREAKDAREAGSPDIRAAKKKAVAVAYRGDDKPGFLKKLGLRFKDPENTALVILDKFDGNSELVAELVTANGFKAAFAIRGGAEGPRGWKNSGLPWTAPKKVLNLDFGDLQDAISSAFGQESSDGLPLTLGLAAATALGVFTATEIETLLQLLGSAAVVQLVTKKLLFAEDRKQTLQQVNEFLNTKVAPKELVAEIKMIGKALLPTSSAAKTLPAPPEGSSTASTSSTTDTAPAVETKTEVKAEASAVAPPQVNSAPVAEVSKESLPGKPRPLSPYPNYPDFKPPSSPSPSTP